MRTPRPARHPEPRPRGRRGRRPALCRPVSASFLAAAVVAGAVTAGSAPPAAAAVPLPTRAAWVQGDSVMVSAIDSVQSGLERDGWRAVVTGFPGLQTWAAVRLFRQVRPRMGSVAVVELGNNACCDAGSFGHQIDLVMQTMNGLPVIWLTAARFRPYEDQVNAAIRAAALRWPNLFVADWGAVADAYPTLTYPDHLHLTPPGQQVMARFLRSQLDLWYQRYAGPDTPSLVAGDGARSITPANRVVFTGAVAGAAPDPEAEGSWVVSTTGQILAYGQARSYGSAADVHLARPIVGMASTPDGHGYWLVGADGGVFTYGDATWYGSANHLSLGTPIVGMASTPDGRGYWLVGAGGGVFSFGDAPWYGSANHPHLSSPVVGLARTSDGHGYWLATAAGGVITFGDARFFGAAEGGLRSARVESIAAQPADKGYLLLQSDDQVHSFGPAGDPPSAPPPASAGSLESPSYPVVMAAPHGGYWVVGETPTPDPPPASADPPPPPSSPSGEIHAQ